MAAVQLILLWPSKIAHNFAASNLEVIRAGNGRTIARINRRKKMAEIFISYARENRDFVRRLDESLKSRGREAWVDWEGIRPTEEFMQAIYGAIEAADTFVFVITPDSVASVVCGREIEHAAAHNKRMVPIVAQDVEAAAVPEPLAKLNWIFCRSNDDFENATDVLISALDTDLKWVNAHTRLLTRAIEWNANGKNTSPLLRGDDLRSAERWLAEAGAQKERQPTELQTEYILASRKGAARRQRITLGAVSIGFVIAIVLAVVALFAEARAKNQTKVAVAATKRTGEIASRGSVSLARHSGEGGKNDRALAQLAQALRLNPDNLEASALTTLMLTQLSWHVPSTGSMWHSDVVYSAQFSPRGQKIVTASWDGTARLWDAGSGKPMGQPMKHQGRVFSAQFSPDGQRIVTASADQTARLWDAISGKPVGQPMTHEGMVNSAQFSPNGQRIVTASADKTARLWDGTSGKPVGEQMEHEDVVNSAQFSPDGQRVVTILEDKTAWLWEVTSGKPLGEPIKHQDVVNSANFSPDGQRIATASWDKTARLWDTTIMTDKDTEEDVLLLAELAEAMAGVTLETVEQTENVKLLAPEEVLASWKKIAAKFSGSNSKLTSLQRFMKWSVSDRGSRTISPFTLVTVSEWLENRMKEGTVEGLQAAMKLDPVNARVTAHLGRHLADQALKQGSDPDEARRTRGEADFLTSRALKLAPENDEVKKLRDEVIKLLELKTD